VLDNGKMDLEMVKAYKPGLMDQDMKDNGLKIKLMEKENLFMQTVTYTKVIGLMTKQMEKEYTHMLTVQSMLVNGRMINNMEKVLKVGLMVPDMR